MPGNNTYVGKKAIWMASAVLFSSIPTFPAGAQNIERPTLTAAQCQPLSADNADLCCIALNRQQLLTDAEIEQCPPLTTARIRAVVEEHDGGNNSGPTAGTIPTDGTGGTPVTTDTSSGGGNTGPGGSPGGTPGGTPGPPGFSLLVLLVARTMAVAVRTLAAVAVRTLAAVAVRTLAVVAVRTLAAVAVRTLAVVAVRTLAAVAVRTLAVVAVRTLAVVAIKTEY